MCPCVHASWVYCMQPGCPLSLACKHTVLRTRWCSQKCLVVCVLTVLHKRNAQVFFGDLVCKWWPWMLAVAARIAALQQEDPETYDSLGLPRHLLLTEQQLEQMTPATPAMHSHGHVWYCQELYGPIHQAGLGNEAGETTELVNAHLSTLAPAVRHMSDGSKLGLRRNIARAPLSSNS